MTNQPRFHVHGSHFDATLKMHGTIHGEMYLSLKKDREMQVLSSVTGVRGARDSLPVEHYQDI